MCVGQVGDEGSAADSWSSGLGAGRFGGFGQDGRVQVAVSIEEAAVYLGSAGDSGDADFATLMGRLFEGCDARTGSSRPTLKPSSVHVALRGRSSESYNL